MDLDKSELLDKINTDDFLSAYFEAMLWSSTDEEGTPLDEDHYIDDFDAASLARLIEVAEDFAAHHGDLVEAGGGDWAQAGHDFWLTRNGHGAGFWDGDWPEEVAKDLTDAADVYGGVDIYEGDDGVLYASE